MTWSRVGLPVVVAGVATALLAGCSGDESASRTSAPSEQVGARAALTGFDCASDDAGAWSASGKVNNAEAQEATYAVRVSVTGEDSVVRVRTTKEVTAAAGSSTVVDLPKFGSAKGKGLKCSAHVTRVLD